MKRLVRAGVDEELAGTGSSRALRAVRAVGDGAEERHVIFEVPECYNASCLLDENLAAGRGAKVAVRTEANELTYAELYDRVCRAGRALRALGVEREQRVLMALDDTPASRGAR